MRGSSSTSALLYEAQHKCKDTLRRAYKGRISARVKCNWRLITKYRARFEPNRLEDCRTTNETQ